MLPSAAIAQLNYETYALPNSLVHVVTVPPHSHLQVAIAVTDALKPLPELAAEQGAIAAINAGFFDPQNGLTTSYVAINGELVADPQQNERLMANPNLQPYLANILNRSEFRIYDCSSQQRYSITAHNTPTPNDCSLESAVGAGPQLLPNMTGYEEGFLAKNTAGEIVRDALGSEAPNARSAIGLTADGTVVLAIAAQLPTTATSGLSFAEMAAFMSELGVQTALNLDGGSSSSLYFEGQTYYGRRDEEGNPIERPIKSALIIR